MSLGEGATSEGEFWESLNTACRLHLPTLFVVADNGYAISVRAADQSPAPVAELVRGFRGLAVTQMDGWDYAVVPEQGGRAIARVRAGEGPGLIHAARDPPLLPLLGGLPGQVPRRRRARRGTGARPHRHLRAAAGVARACSPRTQAAGAARRGTRRWPRRAAEEALAAPRPDPATVTDNVVRAAVAARARARAGAGDRRGDAEPVVMAEAIRLTLHELLAADERIRVFGEDVADADDEVLDHVEGKGGVFGVTRGLQRRFGSARCYNTPLAESNIIGRGIGQALRGLRPCAEIQFFDYIWPAMQQLHSEAATIRWRSNGAFTCPLVVRVAIGGYLTGGAIWHSQSGESIFAHIPGLLDRLPVAGPRRRRAAAQRLRGGGPGALPGAQAPLPPALRGRPHARARDGSCPSGAAPWRDPGAT